MKSKFVNPFELQTYSGPAYFCDREQELATLVDAFHSKRNIVLSAFRRLGKTSLIKHFHHHLGKRKDTLCIYVDVLSTNDDQAFINKVITAIYTEVQARDSGIKKFLQAFRALRPQAGVDPITGFPTLSLDIANPSQVTASLQVAIQMLVDMDLKVQLAIDEFQQIATYKDGTSVDAALRALYPMARNIHFLYSGSEQHLLQALFTDPGKPMFASTEIMHLDKIAYGAYADFIEKMFTSTDVAIDRETVDIILSITERHTFYTQFLCSNLYSRATSRIDDQDVYETMTLCVKQFETSYYYYRKMLSTNQWELLVAIAENNGVTAPYGKQFLNRYGFSASSVKQALTTLVRYQLVHEHIQEMDRRYMVYDVFLKNWLTWQR